MDAMKTVGIRELKNRLSEYVREVRAGQTILLTDRGEVVAELCPPGQGKIDRSLPAGLVEMARKGLIRLGGPNEKTHYRTFPRLWPDGFAAELLDQERGER